MQIRFLAFVLLLPVSVQAQMYRWIDVNGKVHFSDRAPLSGAREVQKQPMPKAPGSTPPLPYALQQASANLPVTLYTSELCKDSCAKARELLDKRGVPYREISVVDEADLAQLKKLSGDHAVPVLTVGREVHKGFESGIYNNALDNAGYPSTSLLPPGVQARHLVAKPARNPVAAPSPGTESGAIAPPPKATSTSR